MSELLKLQFQFVRMLADLFKYAESLGYYLKISNSNFAQVHMKRSLHYLSLAIDLDLFKVIDEKVEYCTKTEDHRELGEYWESLGGSWGGRFKNPDGNHYSIAYKGRK